MNSCQSQFSTDKVGSRECCIIVAKSGGETKVQPSQAINTKKARQSITLLQILFNICTRQIFTKLKNLGMKDENSGGAINQEMKKQNAETDF